MIDLEGEGRRGGEERKGGLEKEYAGLRRRRCSASLHSQRGTSASGAILRSKSVCRCPSLQHASNNMRLMLNVYARAHCSGMTNAGLADLKKKSSKREAL